jgi:hypothetical protein
MKIRVSNFVIVTITALSSCGSAENDKNSMENASPIISRALQNEQTAMLSIQAFNSHNVNEILKNWDSLATDDGDGTWHPIVGIDSIKYIYSLVLKGIPNISVDSLRTLTDNGEHVIVTGQWSGTFKNDSLKAADTKISFWNGDFFTFNENGKIIRHKSIQSNLAKLAQLGLLNKPNK